MVVKFYHFEKERVRESQGTACRALELIGAAAQKLGVNQHAVRRLADEGRLSLRSIPGSHPRVLEADVDRLGARVRHILQANYLGVVVYPRTSRTIGRICLESHSKWTVATGSARRDILPPSVLIPPLRGLDIWAGGRSCVQRTGPMLTSRSFYQIVALLPSFRNSREKQPAVACTIWRRVREDFVNVTEFLLLSHERYGCDSVYCSDVLIRRCWLVTRLERKPMSNTNDPPPHSLSSMAEVTVTDATQRGSTQLTSEVISHAQRRSDSQG